MALSPEAMLRVALMMRDGGSFGGEQVIAADWIAASQVPQTRSPYSGLGYGLGWFLSPSGWTLARGYGGQVIAAHPKQGLAVAITSDPTQAARSGGYFGDLMRIWTARCWRCDASPAFASLSRGDSGHGASSPQRLIQITALPQGPCADAHKLERQMVIVASWRSGTIGRGVAA